ncbi:MAG: hypothetical protein CM1200mP29_04300 [Verrucomicrobiota bacterium]|nr:MAG: hypothetical protein CM1200mP29_04300 [Verrucomicrobiota bacterium]
MWPLRLVYVKCATTMSRQTSSVGSTHPTFFFFDPSKCFVCSRCIRACDDLQVTMRCQLMDAVLIAESLLAPMNLLKNLIS